MGAMAILWTIGLNGTLWVAASWVARHGFRRRAGLAHLLAALTLAWTWATLGMELLGASGSLSREALLAWDLFGLAIGFILRYADTSGPGATPIAPEGPGDWEWTSVVALGMVVWATFLVLPKTVFQPVKVVSDGPIYHLYFAARWWKEGRIVPIATPFGENAATYFPAVGDLWFTWLMICWGGDRLAKVGQFPFLVLAGLAAFAMARRLGAGRAAASIATCTFLLTTLLFLYALEPNVDAIFVAGYLLAAGFFLEYAQGTRDAKALVLGGLAAGGALATKPTGIVFVPVLLGLALATVLRGPGGIAARARHASLLAVSPMVMAGYWYGRNALLTGNPLYPLHLSAFGRVWLAGWYGADAMRFSPFYLPVSDWRSLWDTMLSLFDPRQAPLWVASLAGAWAWRRPRDPRDRWVWGITVLAIANVALAWLLIPYRTQQRFLLHALGLAVVPLARLLDRGRCLRTLAVGLLAVHVLAPQRWPWPGRGPVPWDLSRTVPSRVSSLIPLFPEGGKAGVSVSSLEDLVPILVLLALGLGSLATAWCWTRIGRPASPRRTLRAAVVSLVMLGVMVALTVPDQADPRRLFYPAFPDYYSGWLHLDLVAGRSGTRVAYAGTNLPYYLLGVGLRNEVRYINVDARRGWLLHDYHREARSQGRPTWPNPRPGWDRLRPDFAAWLANLRAERIQVLVVTRANPAEGVHNVADPEGFPIERKWADAHPAIFQPLYGVAERDSRIRIYGIRRPGRG